MEINLHPLMAKILLCINVFPRTMVMCLGYGEDYKQYTELVWEDDKDLDFFDKETYPDFQLWIR